MTTIANRYLAGNFGPVQEELTAFDLPVTGRIPDELDGRYLRNGPNPVTPVDPRLHHWFVGTGMVHGVRLRGGRADGPGQPVSRSAPPPRGRCRR